MSENIILNQELQWFLELITLEEFTIHYYRLILMNKQWNYSSINYASNWIKKDPPGEITQWSNSMELVTINPKIQ